MRHFTMTEILDNGNMYKCDKCKKATRAAKVKFLLKFFLRKCSSAFYDSSSTKCTGDFPEAFQHDGQQEWPRNSLFFEA